MFEQSPQTHLTKEQRRALGQRIVHDAKLIEGGAGFDEYGHFIATPQQITSLQEQHRLQEAEEAFSKTPEYGIISGHLAHLSKIEHTVGAIHGQYPVIVAREDASQGKYPALDRMEETDYLMSNGIDVDLRSVSNATDARNALARIVEAESALERLTNILRDRTDIRIGARVAVPRPADTDHRFGWVQDDWRVRGISANGELFVGLPPRNDSDHTGDIAVDVISIDVAMTHYQ